MKHSHSDLPPVSPVPKASIEEDVASSVADGPEKETAAKNNGLAHRANRFIFIVLLTF